MCIICICIPTGSKTSASENEVAQSCPTLCDPVDCSPPGSSAHGILQARLLEWVAISFSRGSSWPRNWIQVSRGRRFNLWATREAQESEVAQSCPTLCDPMDCSLPGFSVDFPGESTGVGCHFFSRGSSWPRDQTQVSCIAGRRFTLWATREAQEHWSG